MRATDKTPLGSVLDPEVMSHVDLMRERNLSNSFTEKLLLSKFTQETKYYNVDGQRDSDLIFPTIIRNNRKPSVTEPDIDVSEVKQLGQYKLDMIAESLIRRQRFALEPKHFEEEQKRQLKVMMKIEIISNKHLSSNKNLNSFRKSSIEES